MKIALSLLLFFITSLELFSMNITLIDVYGNEKYIEVEKGSSKLTLSKEMHKIKTIKGLDTLENLDHLIIAFSDLTQADVNFWRSIKHISTLQLKFITIEDFSFLQYLPELKAFSISEGLKISNPTMINFSMNPNLEYFEVHGITFDFFPSIKYCPKGLKHFIFYGSIFEYFNVDDFFKNCRYGQFVILNDSYINKL